MIAILIPLLVLLGLSVPAPAVAMDPADPAVLRSWVEGWLVKPHAPPSISVAIAVGDEIVFAHAVGMADVEREIPATPETEYRTYSISKGITAVAVMQLVEAGTLDLEAEIRAYVPSFPRKRWPVRLKHLISHTSGIRHYKESAGEISSTTEYPTLADSLAVFADDPLLFEPGTASQYTSFGINLLTGAVEAASGKAFGEYLRERIFVPASMSSSKLAVAGADNPELARAYWRPRSEKGSNWPIGDELPNVSGRYGSSGVVSTPGDLVRLFIALRAGVLMGSETYERMISTPFTEIDDEQAHGWNLERKELDNGTIRTAIYRSGAGTGYTGALVHYPAENVTAALLVNQNQYKERWDLIETLAAAFLTKDPAEAEPVGVAEPGEVEQAGSTPPSLDSFSRGSVPSTTD